MLLGIYPICPEIAKGEYMNQTPRPTRSEQREQARSKARELREKRAKGDKRKRFLTTIGIAAAITGVVAGVVAGGFVVATTTNTNAENAKKVPANTTDLGGILIGKDLLPTKTNEAKKGNQIVIYQDYQCPICKYFEEPNASQIKTWVESGEATIEFHPISFLDGQSLNEYSSRAANAALCVANSQPGKFFEVNTALYANQPDENTAGPSDSELKETLAGAGVKIDAEVNTCIDQKRYSKYIENRTAETFSQPAVTGTEVPEGTPYILVNGNLYDWEGKLENLANPARFAQFFATHQK
jgi:protein-disulfide isomerase